MKRIKNSKMLMHGFILVTILATARSAEAEITMEAAFQGRCGHTSPCEQLCYEIHDGMYECECIEGYELNKNGYSCQVINSTSSSDGHSKSDEDVLYQKGASFSAKLANDDNDDDVADNQLSLNYASASSASSSNEDRNDDDGDNFFADDKLNSNDYYISAESINFYQYQDQYQDQVSPQEHDDTELTNTSQDVPEFKAKETAENGQQQQRITPTPTSTTTSSSKMTMNRKSVRKSNFKSKEQTQPVATSAATPIEAEIKNGDGSNIMNTDDYYFKQDMSIYDDVNNNQLNLRPLSQDSSSTYQNQNTRNSDSQQMSILNNIEDNQRQQKQQNKNILTTIAVVPGTTTNEEETKISENISNSISNNTPAAAFSEFCNLDCGMYGTCDKSEGKNRCLCPFGKIGNGCLEDTKIRIPKFSRKSWIAFPALRGAYKHVQIRVEFRPESFDGIILLSGERDDLTGDFMALLLNKGFVEFWFDCGSGVGSVRSRETILLNEWNLVIIYRHRWDAWLVLNHGAKVQGRSNGLFSRITFREPVFLGGTGNITGLAKRLPIFNGFVGCIRRFVANEHDYKFEEHPLGDVSKGFDIQDCVTDKCFKYPCQHGGKCLPSDQGALCLCPIGFVGDLCEIRMDLQVPAFNGSSYLRYAPLGDSALIWLELKVILKPAQSDGLILYSGLEKHGDFIALSLTGGFVEFVFDLGSGPAVVRSEYPLSIGQWHAIKVSRTARLAVLKVDEASEVMTISSNGFWHLSLPENLFLGGVSHVEKLPLNLKSKPFFVGCIQKIDINGHALVIISEALGGNNIGNCPHACVARPCGPLAECVPQMESYECRCSAFNAQCNKAAEVPPDELQKMSRAKNNRHKIIETKQQMIKSKKIDGYKQMKLHGKEHAKYMHKSDAQQPTVTPPVTIAHSSATKATSAGVRRVAGEDTDIEDDIIFRDVHGMHRKHGHNEQAKAHQEQQQRNNAKIQRNASIGNTKKAEEENISKHQGKGHHHHHHQHKHRSSDANKKHDPHHKHTPIGKQHKLSRLPTHYESFQANPDSDILTFDDNIEFAESLLRDDDQNYGRGDDDDHDSPHNAEPNYDRHGESKEDTESKTEPFVMDKSIFDDKDGTMEEYHRKQLEQDMRRIMANTQHERTTKRPPPPLKLSVTEYQDEYIYENDDDDNDEHDDDLLELVASTPETIESSNEESNPPKHITTPQTHTDWSLLKKLDLSADHQGQIIGVRKNFGACFVGQDSYFHYSDAETMSQIISYNIDLNLRIKTHSNNGVILWTGRQATTEEDNDYLSLGIEDGYLHFRYDLGSGEVNIKFNTTKISDGLWHRVRAIRDSQEGFLEVDGRKTATQYSPGKLRQLNTDTGLYVGGMPDVSYFTRRKYNSGIVGCISEIVLAGELKLNFDPNTLGTEHNVETGIL